MAAHPNARLFVYMNFMKNARKKRKLLCLLSAALLVRRRRALLCSALLLTLSSLSTSYIRQCRRLHRNQGWFETIFTRYSNRRFKRTFRVSKDTFNFILNKIGHHLLKQTVTEEPIPPANRLAVCLYQLARGDYFYTVSQMSGIGVSTVSGIIKEVTEVLVDCLWEECVMKYMPKSEEDFRTKIIEMESMWQFPFTWAGIDGCHIPVKCPVGGAESRKEYYNFKNFYSVILMALVDSHYRFIWGSCGFPGNSHDAIIFQSTSLWNDITERNLIPDIYADISGVKIKPILVGDSAFPFEQWLMKPYTNAVPTEKQHYYNYRLSRARMVTEGAYGQLKGRWRVLLRKTECQPQQVKYVTLACMILHNICIERGDTLCSKFDITLDPETNQRRPSDEVRELLHMTVCPNDNVRANKSSAICVRNAITNKLWKEK